MLPLLAAGAALVGSLFQSKTNENVANQNYWAQVQQNASNQAFQQQINSQNIGFQQEQNALNRAAQESINQQVLADKEKDRALQQEFAQMGITWRMQDAERAGIHPLAALGGSGASYSPSAISLGAPQGVAPQASAAGGIGTAPRVSGNNVFGQMGQDVSRALLAMQNNVTKNAAFETAYQELTLKNLGLRNDLIASQIAKLSSPGTANAGPDWPGELQIDDSKQTPIIMDNKPINQMKGDSGAQAAQDQFGDFWESVFGTKNLYRTYRMNQSGYGLNAQGVQEPGIAAKYFDWVAKNMIADQFEEEYFRRLDNRLDYHWGGWKRGMVPYNPHAGRMNWKVPY